MQWWLCHCLTSQKNTISNNHPPPQNPPPKKTKPHTQKNPDDKIINVMKETGTNIRPFRVKPICRHWYLNVFIFGVCFNSYWAWKWFCKRNPKHCTEGVFWVIGFSIECNKILLFFLWDKDIYFWQFLSLETVWWCPGARDKKNHIKSSQNIFLYFSLDCLQFLVSPLLSTAEQFVMPGLDP